MGIEGADVEQLRSLAGKFDTGAQTLERLRTELGPSSPASAWAGPDGDGFRHLWSARLSPSLTNVGQSLHQAAVQLRSNADAQERTSDTLDGTNPFSGVYANASGTASAGAGSTAGTVFDGTRPDGSTSSIDASGELKLGKDDTFFGALTGLSLSTAAVSAKGFTTYTAKSDLSAGVEGGASAKEVAVSGSYVRGKTSDFEIKVPDGTDPRTIDPTDPSTMPTGSSAMLKNGHYVDEAGSASVYSATAEGDSKFSDGTSTAVEKIGENTVRITAGPTAGVEQYTGLGVDSSGFKLMLGGQQNVDYGSYHTADLDLSTPAGAAAYQDYLHHGSFPAHAADGVTGTTSIEKVDATSASNLKLDTPVFKAAMQLGSTTHSDITHTTLPDGSSRLDIGFQDGAQSSHVTVPIDSHGNEITADREYTYQFPASEQSAGFLSSQFGITDQSQADLTGHNVQVTFNEGQMNEFLNQAHRAALTNPSSPVSSYTHDFVTNNAWGTKPVDDPGSFGLSLTQAGSDKLAEVMWNVSQGADGNVDNGMTPFPGTVTVSK